jgi:hypothetical protein
MFVTDETVNAKSQVIFYRCSICVSEHVSSEPIFDVANTGATEPFEAPTADTQRYLMI